MARKDECHLTHDNGGRPFKVCFNGASFWVLKRGQGSSEYDTMVVKPTRHTRAFVGHSPLTPMTEFSGGHGPKFDGNSMLFELGRTQPLRYMFIGECVRVFSTRSHITRFESPVGNNDVPYPYAVDSSGVVYLLTEGVRLTAGPYPKEVLRDPYRFYYDRGLLTPDAAVAEQGVQPFEGITKFYIGSEPYTAPPEAPPARSRHSAAAYAPP
jgi:hypothetical protein